MNCLNMNMLQWISKTSFLGGCLVTLGITSKNPRPSTNAARVPLFLRTTLPKTRIEADGTESLCSSSSLMHSRYERERKERERERERKSVHFQTKISYRRSSCWSTTCLKRGRTESFGF